LKKALAAIGFIVLLLLSNGCPLKVERIVITKYPDRLIYIAGYDTELDLTGGEVEYFHSNGPPEKRPMDHYFIKFVHEIDFNTPGVYVVESQHAYKIRASCSFAIQVVDRDYIDNLINQ